MRFLCFHGIGTNSKVLEIQTATLRYELGDDHTYDFIEGTFPAELDEAILDIAPSGSQGFSYFDPESIPAALQTLDDIDNFIAREGPYDGVLAFSQGMMAACTLLVQKLQEGKALPFKCAIFFSPTMAPLDYHGLCNGRVTQIEPATNQELIKIPTTLIWGSADPSAAKAAELQSLFEAKTLSTHVHEGGHEIPGYALQSALTRCVNLARRSIDRSVGSCNQRTTRS